MTYYLMNGDVLVTSFDLQEFSIRIVEEEQLPYMLRGYIKSTDGADFKSAIESITALRDFFSSRLLNLSRSGAKEILNVAAFPQSVKTEERVKIALACRGLSMTDNYWVKKWGEEICFQDVCLRNHSLTEKSYEIAILQHHISATREELHPDLCSGGMFPKFWKRGESDTPELWKTDRSKDFIFTNAELKASEILDCSDVRHVNYHAEKKDGILFAVSKCFTNDDVYFVTASDLIDYRCHTAGTSVDDSKKWLALLGGTDFANMVCVDYILANTDRHIENYGFLADARTNELLGLAPLFDHNQCLITGDIDDLPYEPLNLNFKNAVDCCAPKSNFCIRGAEGVLPVDAYKRYKKIRGLQRGLMHSF